MAQHPAALLEFLGTFATVSERLETTADLSDGVALFEALSELAPDYFDPTTIARHLGDNWALKSSNLRKLTRNLEQYYKYELKKDTNFSYNLQKIARENDDSVLEIAELVAAAACTCPDKGTYVNRIMGMSPESQLQLKEILTNTMSRLSDYEEESTEADEEYENEINFDGNSKPEPTDDAELLGPAQQQLHDTRKEVQALELKFQEESEENQKAQSRLQAIIEDLQDRLMKRQDELIATEEELQNKTSELQDKNSELARTQEEKSNLADELDVYKDKAQKLYRAEAQLFACQKKLEAAGNQTLESQTDQTEKYLQQITELEMEVKKASHLQTTIQNLQQKIESTKRELSESKAAQDKALKESDELKVKLQEAEQAKRLFEGDLAELRARSEAMAGDGIAASDEEILTLKNKVSRLEAENAKINSDKTKLEAYTKRTLSKFQDKYLVALQECKSKLKEKQDKIEQLEKRSVTERKSQKREERLLSSTIYELGLSIMQTRLKSEAHK